MNLAQQSGSIENILDAFFGFLQGKTDFFTGGSDEAAAETLVLKYYKKHWKAGQKRRGEMQEKNKIADEERKAKAELKKKADEEEYTKRQEELKASRVQEVTDEEAAAIQAKKQKKEEENGGDNDDAKSDEGSKDPPPEGNGGKTDKYTWTQTLGALEVFVPVRPGVRAKEVTCDIGNDTLKVGVKGEPLILNGKMFAKVKSDDC